MVNYHKYMFDDFVVKGEDDKEVFVEDVQLPRIESEEIIEIQDKELEKQEEIIEETSENAIQSSMDATKVDNMAQDFDAYNYTEKDESIENITTYTEEELKEAIQQAESVAYNKGVEETQESILKDQNILLEDIKNQLMTIFASLEEKKSDLENSALNFAVRLVEKMMPTLEKERAENEVKNFLAENFANFSSQEYLSFSFNPDMLSNISGSIRNLAEQNDFEGKISIHKDISLGLSDCRVEWKSGGVERKTANFLDKVKKISNIEEQERENGE